MGKAIGNCEWCGVVDHNLVDGECQRCKQKVISCSKDKNNDNDVQLTHKVKEQLRQCPVISTDGEAQGILLRK